MKNFFFISLYLLLSFNGFAQSPQQEILELQRENDSLKMELAQCRFEKLDLKLNNISLNEKDYSQRQFLSLIKEQSEEKYKIALEAIEQTAIFISYIDSLRIEMANRSGGFFYKPNTKGDRLGVEIENASKWGKPVGYQRKDIVNLIIIEEGKGKELKDKIVELSNKYLGYINSNVIFEDKIVLKIDEEGAIENDKTWEEYNFGHMPLAATYPMFANFKNNSEKSLLVVLLYLKEN